MPLNQCTIGRDPWLLKRPFLGTRLALRNDKNEFIVRQPKQSKFRKPHRSKGFGRGAKVQQCKRPIGSAQLALIAQGSGRISARQIEAGRVVVAQGTRRLAKVTLPCFPDYPVTQKGDNSRIGKGKGNPHHWVFVVCPGDVLYTVEGNIASTDSTTLTLWSAALLKAGMKLPVATSVTQAQTFPSDQPLSTE